MLRSAMKSGCVSQAVHGELCEGRPNSGGDLLDRKACKARTTKVTVSIIPRTAEMI